MPKAKTHKATAKRIKVTKKKKLLKRYSAQDHFNAREPGKVKHQKRCLGSVSKADEKNVRRALPYLK
ncbi:50S ribosomal protein L35 [Patescibacteria group bacterium]|nr:50S ribosomal protein L35 [Patescibacteria group bacterium]